MRLVYGTLAMVGLVSVGSSLLGACSNDASDCELTNTCSSGASGSSSTGSSGSSGAGGGSSSSSSSTSTSSSSGSGGSGGATPMSCVPTDVVGGVADDCGVFVSASLGKDANTGLGKKQAVQTLAHAIAIAGKGSKRIYACAESFVEAAVVPAGFEIYGGLNCGTDWSHSATKTGITPGPDDVPLTLQGGAKTTHIEDLAPTAMDATPATGGSSIAVIADGVTAEIVNCDLTAGKGAAGVPGMAPMGTGTPGADAPAPVPANKLDGCVSAMTTTGGDPGQTTCAGIADTGGGPGGNGTTGGAGGVGSPAATFPEPNAMGSLDGKGGDAQTTSPVVAQCTPGDGGASGNDGTSGAGASGLGDISGSGYIAPPAMPGATPGQPGYGGGGGGGAKKCANNFAGPAGGGGGAGGCGGQPGAPGSSAGSSIGLVSNAATLALNGVKITTSDGGIGGLGGGGQVGGQGGKPGIAGNGDAKASACNGGKGGLGGRGGSGGGGLGGHSIGIATKAGKVTQTNVTTAVTTGGVGGIGGDGDVTPGVVGEGGKACKTLAFDTIDCVM